MNLSQIKTILQMAGINRLQIQFDNDQQHVNADYVFRGKPGKKQISYEEITKSLSIGRPGPPVSAQPAQAQQLSELSGEK